MMKQYNFIKVKNFFLTLILLTSFAHGQTTYTTVASLLTAAKAAATAGTGGVFILKDGTYSGASFSFTSNNGSKEFPITIKAQTIGGVTLTGSSSFTFTKCAYFTVEGFKMDCTGTNSLVKLSGCNNMRFTRNDFKLTTTTSIKWFYIGGVYDDIVYPYTNPSHHNRVDHNNFHDKTLPGHYITIDGNNSKDQSQYDVIDHNYFSNNSPRAANEQESIRVGWSDMSKSSGYTTVEYNLFENCDGDPEVVSIKSCDNIVRHNTFNGNYGTLSFRHGNRNRAEGNYFFGNNRPIGSATYQNYDLSYTTVNLYTGGMRVYGTDHVIINNYFEGLNGTKWDAPITLTQGDATQTSTALSNHFRIERLMVAYNTLVNNDQGIELGFSNNGAYGLQMQSVTIANNLITGSKNSLVKIVDGKDPGSAVTWSNNLMYPTGTATIFANGANTTNPFSTAQVVNENPNLVFDPAQKTWRSGVDTPLYTNTSLVTNDEDIDGQSRPAPSNPGADHYDSLTSVRYMPMTTATVGPYAYENVPLALSPITSFALAGESKTTTVTTALAWTASVNSSWLSIDNASGSGNGTINVTATANTTGAARSGTLTVTGAGASPVIITVNQDGPTITLSAVANFVAAGETKATAVTSNVAWTASIDNPSWLSINTTSGTNNGSINITAAANTLITSRTGTLTLMGGGLTKTLTITQDAAVSSTPLINSGALGFPVTATATQEQIPTTGGTNLAMNSLDKNTATRWSDFGTGSANTPYGEITYNLGNIYTLESIKIATTGTSTKWYFYDIQFSSDGSNYTEKVRVTSAAAGVTTFATYPFTNVAQYVKITGVGNNGTAFTTISEIEFYGNTNLSVAKNELKSQLIVYPNPASTTINVQMASANATQATIYSIDGRLVLSKKLNSSESSQFSMDVSTLKRGNYVLKLEDNSAKVVNSKIISITK